MFNYLEKLIETYNQEHENENGRAYLQQYENRQIDRNGETKSQPLVLAICTALTLSVEKRKFNQHSKLS